MKKVIKIECKDCGGTGIYKGMAERDMYGVVCSTCKGTGYVDFEYEEFKKKRPRFDVEIVVERNPGICIGKGEVGKPLDFGGVPYHDWFNATCGFKFPKGSEMRQFVCPAWWNGRELKKCRGNRLAGSRYQGCPCFHNKAECWKVYDEEK